MSSFTATAATAPSSQQLPLPPPPRQQLSDRQVAFQLRYEELMEFRQILAKSKTSTSQDRLRRTVEEMRKMEQEYQKEFGMPIRSIVGGHRGSGEGNDVTNKDDEDDDGHSTTTIEDSEDEKFGSARKRPRTAMPLPSLAATSTSSIASSLSSSAPAGGPVKTPQTPLASLSLQPQAPTPTPALPNLQIVEKSPPRRKINVLVELAGQKPDMKFEKLFTFYHAHARKLHLSPGPYGFQFEGQPVYADDTPDKFGMNQLDTYTLQYVRMEPYAASPIVLDPDHGSSVPVSSNMLVSKNSENIPPTQQQDNKNKIGAVAPPPPLLDEKQKQAITPAPAPIPPQQRKVVVLIRRPLANGPTHSFRVGYTQPFVRLFEVYSRHIGRSHTTLVFQYQGQFLSSVKTPAMLNMSDNETISAYTTEEYSQFLRSQAGIGNPLSDSMDPFAFAGEFGQTIGAYSHPNDTHDIPDDELQKKLEKLFDCFSVDIPPNERVDAPAAMTVQLKEYQRIGVAWMSKMEKSAVKGGILSDEMGLGKTVQTIACVLANPRSMPQNPSAEQVFKPNSRRRHATLVVLPLSLMEQWRTELETLVSPSHKLRILQYHSDFLRPSERREFESQPKSFDRYDFVLTTYSGVANQFPFDKDLKRQYTMNTFELDKSNKNVGPIFRYNWHRVILDEAHTIKNRSSQMSVAVSYLEADRRWCLTGTPIQNSSDDLYALLRFLKMEPYCYWNRFRQDLSMQPQKSDPYRSREQRMQKLQTILQCCLLRRTKSTRIDGSDQPIITLPPRDINQDQPEFTPVERELYNAFEQRNVKKFNNMLHELERHYRSILVMIMRMRQMCLHYKLVEKKFSLKTDITDVNKLDELMEELDPDVVQRLRRLVEDEEADECAICLDATVNPAATICGHVFCEECISNHMKISERNNRDCICPHCRGSISLEELIPMEVLEKKFKEQDEEGKEDAASCKKKKLTEEEEEGGNPEEEWEPSTKITRLMELLEETRRTHPGEKTIIFCSFTKMLDLVEKPLNDGGFNYVRLDGTMCIADRADAVQQLKEDPETTVMLISLRCGSVGLNLTAANRVVLLDVWWNPALENQAIDRVHRIGQMAERVYVTKITIPNTIEDRILELQKRKQELTDQALNEGPGGENKNAVRRLSRNELIYLFRGGGRAPPPAADAPV